MKSWLNNDSDYDSDSEIWHITKQSDFYTFKDLTEWLNKRDVVKGKRPAIGSSGGGKKSVVSTKGKKKEREATTSEESEEEAEKKKLNLKAKSKFKKKKTSE